MSGAPAVRPLFKASRHDVVGHLPQLLDKQLGLFIAGVAAATRERVATPATEPRTHAGEVREHEGHGSGRVVGGRERDPLKDIRRQCDLVVLAPNVDQVRGLQLPDEDPRGRVKHAVPLSFRDAPIAIVRGHSSRLLSAAPPLLQATLGRARRSLGRREMEERGEPKCNRLEFARVQFSLAVT